MILAEKSPDRAHDCAPHIHTYTHLVCHAGELVLKGNNRRWFEQKLIQKIRESLDGIRIASLRSLGSRVLIEFAESYTAQTLELRIAKVFGIANARPVWRVGWSIEELETAVAFAVDGCQFRSFAVRCRRAEKRFPMSSQEIAVRVGSFVAMRTGARVDLTHPELTVTIDVLSHEILLSTHRIAGPAGLPVGVSGRVACLLSGGIDSPVAAWRIMRRGCDAVALHFHSHPFTKAASQEKVVELARLLAQWHGPLPLAMIAFGEIQQHVVARVPERYRILIYRRLMVRIATAVAAQRRAIALVTGDSLAQVASQTLPNMTTIDAVATLPILRPLIGQDKEEIIRTARQIGTFDLSIEPYADDCCNFLEPQKPATRSTPAELTKIEAVLDIDALVAQGVAATTWQVIGSMDRGVDGSSPALQNS